MRTKLLLAAAVLFAGAVSANSWWPFGGNDTITVVNPSAKTSPATVFGKAVQKSLGAEFYQAANCEDAVAKYAKTENAVMIYNSSIEFAARNKGLNCLLEQEKNKTIKLTAATPMKICRLPGSTKDFGAEETTLGMASMYATKAHENKFRADGKAVKIVPYSGSKSVLAALYAGDIDLGWMGSGLATKQGDKLECLYSTDPNHEQFLGKTVNNAIPDFSINYVVYTNSTDSAVLAKLDNILADADFQKYLKKSQTRITDMTADQVIAWVQFMFDNWADR